MGLHFGAERLPHGMVVGVAVMLAVRIRACDCISLHKLPGPYMGRFDLIFAFEQVQDFDWVVVMIFCGEGIATPGYLGTPRSRAPFCYHLAKIRTRIEASRSGSDSAQYK